MAVLIFSAQTSDVNEIINIAVRIHRGVLEEGLIVDGLMFDDPYACAF